jgi:cytochrome bd-type quinol oxidase subunit 2
MPDLTRESANHATTHWSEALFTLCASRIALIVLESKEVAQHIARRILLMVAIAVCVLFMWALVLAAAIAAIAESLSCPWYFIALAAAAAHWLAAVFLVRASQRPSKPAFPVTRSEFLKDREWIKNLQKSPKSNV